MKQSNESRRIVRQNDKCVQKSQKHEVNLQKNSTLYFQVGLILCLLVSYSALEMTFASTGAKYAYVDDDIPEDVEFTSEKYKIYEEPKAEEPEIEIKKKETKVIDDIKVVDNDDELKQALNLTTESQDVKKKQVLNPDQLDVLEEPSEPVSILAVQNVPIYPGCEKASNNAERRKCMSEKLGKLIQKKFDTDLGGGLGLSGKQQIYVSFKINKKGNVEILKTRAPHKKLEKEANRVISKVPKMTPGKNDNKPVEVLYMLPIKFNIQH